MSPQRLASLLLAMMLAQSVLGLLLADHYRDAEWIKAAWQGNDWVSLVVAGPLLWIGIRAARRGSVRGRLLVLAMSGYALYNDAFYLFGAALNVFFPLYVLLFVVAAATLGVALSHVDVAAVAKGFDHTLPVRVTAVTS